MVKRKRLRRKKKIGSWRIRKTLNPPWVVLSRLKWKDLPKEAVRPRRRK